MVREAIGSALPNPRKKPERPRWKLKPAVKFIDAILQGDRKEPRKQRNTAHRIWARMQSELPECKIAERTVREYDGERHRVPQRVLAWYASRNACCVHAVCRAVCRADIESFANCVARRSASF